MITDAVVQSFLAAVSALLTLVPAFTLPDFLAGEGAANTVAQGWRAANGVLPVYTIAQTLTAYLLVLLGLRLWDVAVWVFHQFWGSS